MENVVRAIPREGGIKLGTPSRADFAGKTRQMAASDPLVMARARVAIVATMRKLLTILNAIIRDKKPWKNA